MLEPFRRFWLAAAIVTCAPGDEGDIDAEGEAEAEAEGGSGWLPMADAPIAERKRHAAVWTGSEMIVWGGDNSEFSGKPCCEREDGARYDPAEDLWRLVPRDETEGVPRYRSRFSAVWTGSEMVIWGGRTSDIEEIVFVNSGSRYDPANDTWTPTSTDGAPAGRTGHEAVWTGSEMLVWCGMTPADGQLWNGGRYDPAADMWQPIADDGEPVRECFSAVWTGSEMIVLGTSTDGSATVGAGSRYDAAADEWVEIARDGAVVGRHAVWTGSELIAWGLTVDSVGRYNPATGTWAPAAALPEPPPPDAESATVVWTGSEMIVWGGHDPEYSPEPDAAYGARYDPVADAWALLPGDGAPSPRGWHSTVWTGSEMIIWGGRGWAEDGTTPSFADGARFAP